MRLNSPARLRLVRLTALALLTATLNPARSQEMIPRKPVRAPAFSTTTLSHKRITLAGLRGKVVLLEFWATWCGPCRMEIPELISIQKQFSSRPLSIVSLSMDDDSTISDVKPFTKELRINYPVGVSVEDNVRAAQAYNAEALPTLVLIDKKGYERWICEGYGPDIKPHLVGRIKELIAEKM